MTNFAQDGRHPLPTVELTRRIATLIEQGNYPSTAAQFFGISHDTLSAWLSRGENARAAWERGEPVAPTERAFLDFLNTVKRARAVAEVNAVDAVLNAIRGGQLIEESVHHYPDGSVEIERTYAPPDEDLALEFLGRAFRKEAG
jgi:hypothetical protein